MDSKKEMKPARRALPAEVMRKTNIEGWGDSVPDTSRVDMRLRWCCLNNKPRAKRSRAAQKIRIRLERREGGGVGKAVRAQWENEAACGARVIVTARAPVLELVVVVLVPVLEQVVLDLLLLVVMVLLQ